MDIQELPKYSLWGIIDKLHMKDIFSLCVTSREFSPICSSDDYWKHRISTLPPQVLRRYGGDRREDWIRLAILKDRISEPSGFPPNQYVLRELEIPSDIPFTEAPTNLLRIRENITQGDIPTNLRTLIHPKAMAKELDLLIPEWRKSRAFSFQIAAEAGEKNMPYIGLIPEDSYFGYNYGISVGGHKNKIREEMSSVHGLMSTEIVRGLVIGGHDELLDEAIFMFKQSPVSDYARLIRYLDGMRAAMIWNDASMFRLLLSEIDFSMIRGHIHLIQLFEDLLRWGRWSLIDMMLEATPENIRRIYVPPATRYGFKNLVNELLSY